MYDDDHDGKSSLTKVVVMAALISATSVISLISFSFDAEAQTFGDNNNNNNPNSALLTELFTNDKQSADTVNIATTTDPSNTITNVVTSLITRGSYMNPYIDIKGGGGLDTTLESVEAAVIGSREIRGFLLTDTTTAQSPAAKAGIQGGDLLAADIRGSYTEISRIINIPKDIPNSSSSSIVPNSSNLTNAILTYQNNSYGIRIQYPANWTKSEQELDPNDNVTNIVALSSPLLSTFDNFSETLAISTETLSNQNMTLKEYATSLVTDYNKTLTDFKLIDLNTKVVLGGKPAYGLTYTDREDNINYKTAEIGTIIGDRIYYVEYIAEEKQYSDYLPKIKMMIDSLQIT
jgi:PsbP-like protein